MEFYLNRNNLDEIFLYISEEFVPGIKPWYLISNYGSMYSINKNRFMKTTTSCDGYKVCTVRTYDGRGVTIYVHRIEMLTFKYEPGCELLHVDHVNCNKQDNYISNLEWVTTEENTRRAANNGLMLSGENAPWTKVDNNKVHEICKLYVNGFGISSISRIVDCGIDSVFRIVHGIGRTDISSQYDIEKIYRGYLTEQQIHLVCKLFSKHKNLDYMKIKPLIAEALGIRIDRNIDSILRCLYRHDIYCYYRISSLYEY